MPLTGEKTYEALLEIAAQIQAEEMSLDAVLDTIVTKAAQLVDADFAWVALLDPDDDGRLLLGAANGLRQDGLGLSRPGLSLPMGRGVGGVALARRETLIVPDYSHYLQDTTDEMREAVAQEGIVSAICAPMLREDRLVGALYVANRTIREFDAREASLVTTLAGQASIAIENSRLLEQLATKNRLLEESNRLLEKAEAIHRRLTDAALQQAGLEGVAAILADLLGRALRTEQDIVAPFEHIFGLVDHETSWANEWPIAAGNDVLGRLWVAGPPLDDLGLRAVEHGITVLAVELLKQRAAQEVEWRLGAELLKDLLESPGPVDRRLSGRAGRFGIDLSRPHRIVVLETTDSELDPVALRGVVARSVVPGQRAVLLSDFGSQRVVLTTPPGIEEQLDEVLHAVARAGAGQGEYVIGVSRPGTDMPRALREALACARFAAVSGSTCAMVKADDLGAMAFLFALENPAPLAEYVREQLGPLLDYERRKDSQLLVTLRAFLESDGHHGAIAERCHIHQSTVKYRLSRIAEILQRRLSDPTVRFELRLAFALTDVLTVLSPGDRTLDPTAEQTTP